jgi:hypothetical protein
MSSSASLTTSQLKSSTAKRLKDLPVMSVISFGHTYLLFEEKNHLMNLYLS